MSLAHGPPAAPPGRLHASGGEEPLGELEAAALGVLAELDAAVPPGPEAPHLERGATRPPWSRSAQDQRGARTPDATAWPHGGGTPQVCTPPVDRADLRPKNDHLEVAHDDPSSEQSPTPHPARRPGGGRRARVAEDSPAQSRDGRSGPSQRRQSRGPGMDATGRRRLEPHSARSLVRGKTTRDGKHRRTTATSKVESPVEPRCIVALQLDGGTRLLRPFDPDRLQKPVSDLLIRCRERVRTRDEAKRDRDVGGWVERLPMPQLSLWDQEPLAEVGVTGERRQILAFYIPDVVRIEFNLEGGAADGPFVRLEFKAKTLWDAHARKLVAFWIGAVDWMCGGSPALSLRIDPELGRSDAHVAGWEVVNIELCSDFVGISWRRDDSENWVCPPRMRCGQHVKCYGIENTSVETIEAGKRTSNVSWCLYWKTRQIEAVKHGDGSTYEAHWLAAGWKPGQEIARAELRICKRGLVVSDDETGEVLNFRDPARLFDRDALGKLWAAHTRTHRIVVPGTATRQRRATVDERWELVQSATDVAPVVLRQDREPRRLSVEAAKSKAWRQMWQACMRYASLAYCEVRGIHGLVSTMRLALWEAEQRQTDVLDVMGEYGDNYVELRKHFIGHEMVENGTKLLAKFGRPLPGLVLRDSANLPPKDTWHVAG